MALPKPYSFSESAGFNKKKAFLLLIALGSSIAFLRLRINNGALVGDFLHGFNKEGKLRDHTEYWHSQHKWSKTKKIRK